jgi:hypothetical protein
VPGIGCASGTTDHTCAPDARGKCGWQITCRP